MAAFLTHAEALDHLNVYQDDKQQDLAVVFIGGTVNKEALACAALSAILHDI